MMFATYCNISFFGWQHDTSFVDNPDDLIDVQGFQWRLSNFDAGIVSVRRVPAGWQKKSGHIFAALDNLSTEDIDFHVFHWQLSTLFRAGTHSFVSSGASPQRIIHSEHRFRPSGRVFSDCCRNTFHDFRRMSPEHPHDEIDKRPRSSQKNFQNTRHIYVPGRENEQEELQDKGFHAQTRPLCE